jgi:phage terminase large subunit-like protein
LHDDSLDTLASFQSSLLREAARLAKAAAKAGGPRNAFYELDAFKHQTPGSGDWTVFLLLGGRGAGKTRAGAEWIGDFIRNRTEPARVALVAETYADGREVMIDGDSGLARLGEEKGRPAYQASRRRLVWPNGSVAYVFSSEDPDGLRGHQFHAAWSDELCKWKHAEETWSNLQLALRLGPRPRQVVTTTPRPTALLKRLMKAPGTFMAHATTYANAQNLSRVFLDEIAAAYEGTRLGRQELHGELVEDVAGALWTRAMIERSRIAAPQGFHETLDRIVVAVDPPATSGEGADECGIIVAGAMNGADGAVAYVLADRSAGGLSPRDWARRAVAAYHEFAADRIVVETNQGGDMVREVIRGVDASVAVRDVRASRGKRLRAEPVAALYEQGRVRHAGRFPALEDQMATYTGAGGTGPAKSPDRLDALVWAIADLLLRREAAPRVNRIG